MRVISGSAKRLQLKTIEGLDTRPTTDRIKETLFNLLQNNISGCNFLDLFSGSGAIGIEALSRGANIAYFVENNKKAVDCIKYNLQFTKLNEKALIMQNEVIHALTLMEQRKINFDLVFMDPPYGKGLEREVLKYLSGSGLIDYDSMIIIEADKIDEFTDIDNIGFQMIKQKVYKTNQHLFLKKNQQ